MNQDNSKKSRDSFARWFAIAGVALGVLALLNDYRLTTINEKTQKLQIDPVIDCFFETETQRQFKLTIKNPAPLGIVSLSIDHFNFIFNRKEMGIVRGATISPEYYAAGQNWAFKEILKPNELFSSYVPSLTRLSSEKLTSENYVEIFYFLLNYYRESDMNKYTKRCLFFFDKDGLFSEKELKKKDYFSAMEKEILAVVSSMRSSSETFP